MHRPSWELPFQYASDFVARIQARHDCMSEPLDKNERAGMCRVPVTPPRVRKSRYPCIRFRLLSKICIGAMSSVSVPCSTTRNPSGISTINLTAAARSPPPALRSLRSLRMRPRQYRQFRRQMYRQYARRSRKPRTRRTRSLYQTKYRKAIIHRLLLVFSAQFLLQNLGSLALLYSLSVRR